MKKNKLILFDWGNIVESHTTGYTCYNGWDDLIEECGYKTKERTILKELDKYNICKIHTIEEFENIYNEMKNEFNLNKSFEEFKNLHNSILSKIDYYPDVVSFEHSLKDECYIGIFSNLTVLDKDRLDKQVDLDKYDYVFLSYEMESEKPEIKAYEIIKNKLSDKFNNEDILFIDDKESNIETAKQIGWNTLHITGLELDKIKEVCRNFLKD